MLRLPRTLDQAPSLLPGHLPEHRRTINVFVLAMLSLAAVISLRNLPLTAEYGIQTLFFYLIATVFFMLPYALVSAELASGWPKSGGVYVWVREAMGDRLGFFAIWMQWFHNMTWYPAMLAFVGAGIAQFINPALAQNQWYLTGIIFFGMWGVTFLNFLGIKHSAFISTFCVIVGSIIPGALLIFLGFEWYFTGLPTQLSFAGASWIPNLTDLTQLVFLAGVFLSLAGLEANANLAREAKNPQKNYPRAILIAAFLAVGILVLGSMAIAVVIPKEEISLVSGVLDAFRSFFSLHGLSWIVPVISAMVILGAIGELNAWTIAGVKGLFVTTEHGCLPPVLHKVNKRHVPINLLYFQAIIVSIAAITFLYLKNINIAYWILSALSAQMYLVCYILLLVSGVILRYRKPHVARPYHIPGGQWGIWGLSILGIAACLFALGISFIPPSQTFKIESIFKYELLLGTGFVFSILLPLIIYALKKPHWQLDVLKDIREEIFRSTH